ncbi:unnamed protein product [Citrullus colocynthis]|uniref:NADPH-dependent pterin aldehyde reductase-like n=1 Tax=Citrullus colocynthis TaxID=252529 RepID=A0ABP0Z3W2_9ROSI
MIASAYSASKWAIEGLTKSVAKEVGDGMTIVALDPGIINTQMLAFHFGDLASQYQSPKQCSGLYSSKASAFSLVNVPWILEISSEQASSFCRSYKMDS